MVYISAIYGYDNMKLALFMLLEPQHCNTDEVNNGCVVLIICPHTMNNVFAPIPLQVAYVHSWNTLMLILQVGQCNGNDVD